MDYDKVSRRLRSWMTDYGRRHRMSHRDVLETKLRLNKYRWRAACLSLIPLFLHQCGEAYGVEWMSWVGFYLLSVCIGACIWLSCEIVDF